MTPEEHRVKNRQWEEHLRSMVNPQYAEQEGTESHERAVSADIIDGLQTIVDTFDLFPTRPNGRSVSCAHCTAEVEITKLRAVAAAAGNLSITADGVRGDETDARVLREAKEAAR